MPTYSAVLTPRCPEQEFVAETEYEVMPGSARGTCLMDPTPEEAGPAPEDAPDCDWRPGARETVLLVEDDKHVRALMRLILQDRGYRVLAARDGEEALALARSYPAPINLLLTDVVMPRLGGRELAEQLPGAHPETKVVYFSGYSEHTLFNGPAPVRGDGFLQKPFTAARLVLKVREVLDRAGPRMREPLFPREGRLSTWMSPS